MPWTRISPAVQWLGLGASRAGGTGPVPGQGTKILNPTCHMTPSHPSQKSHRQKHM